jgi:DNA-directed RNA polymerase specialized sigma24 family protein
MTLPKQHQHIVGFLQQFGHYFEPLCLEPLRKDICGPTRQSRIVEELRGRSVEDNNLKELAKSMKAMLLVQLQAQLAPDDREKPEVLLSRAGFAAREIADLLKKSQAAVAKSIQRSGREA